MIIPSPNSNTQGVVPDNKLNTTHDQVLDAEKLGEIYPTPRLQEGDKTVQLTGPSTSPERR